MELTELQRYKLSESHRTSSDLLREIRLRQLKGSDLEYMKTLEKSVQTLELLMLW